jgi:hypothetical protein
MVCATGTARSPVPNERTWNMRVTFGPHNGTGYGLAVSAAAWALLIVLASPASAQAVLQGPAHGWMKSQAPAASAAVQRKLSAAWSANQASALTPAQKLTASRAVLHHLGIEFARPGESASGIASEVLDERHRVASALDALRAVDRVGQGGLTPYRLTFPTESDKETAQALAEIKAQGGAATLTAGDALFNEMARTLGSGLCNKASEALDREELNLRAIASEDVDAVPGSPVFWNALDRINAPALARYRAAAQTYAESCLDASLQSLTPAQRQALDQVLGVMLIDGTPECMATRIRPDLVLTARHCLYAYDETFGWQRRAIRSLGLVLVGVPGERWGLAEVDCAADGSVPGCGALPSDPVAGDHLVLRVTPPKAGSKARLPPLPDVVFQAARANQFLVVPGWSTWFTGRSWSANDRPLATAPAISGCLVKSVQNACLINACQSDSGFSGSPILARVATDKLVVVGIFLGAATAYPTCQRSRHNFGAGLPAFLTRAQVAGVARSR